MMTRKIIMLTTTFLIGIMMIPMSNITFIPSYAYEEEVLYPPESTLHNGTLFAHYPFNHNLHDVSHNGHDANMVSGSATYVRSVIGNGVFIDGEQNVSKWEAVANGNADDFQFLHDGSTDYYISTWIHQTDPTFDEAIVFSTGGCAGSVSAIGATLYMQETHLNYIICNGDGVGYSHQISGSYLIPDTDHFIEVAYNSTSDQVQVWVDQVLKATSSKAREYSSNDPDYAMKFGARNCALCGGDIVVDELRIIKGSIPSTIEKYNIFAYRGIEESYLYEQINSLQNQVESLQNQIASINGTVTTLDTQVSIIDTLVDYINTFLNDTFVLYDPPT